MWVEDNVFLRMFSISTHIKMFFLSKFSPLKFRQDENFQTTSGGYFCKLSTNKKIILEKNISDNKLPNAVEIIEEIDIHNQIQQIQSGKMAYTGFTSLNLEDSVLRHKNYELQSDIHFRLLFNAKMYDEIKEHSANIKDEIIYELKKSNNLLKYINVNCNELYYRYNNVISTDTERMTRFCIQTTS